MCIRDRLSGEKALAAITVNYTPCGHCRQFMNELNSGLDLRIHLPGREAHALRDYLPDAFGPKDLEIKTRLMDEQEHGLSLIHIYIKPPSTINDCPVV